MARRRFLTRLKAKARKKAGGLLPVVGLSLALGLFACVAEEERRPDPTTPETLSGEPVVRVLLVEGAKQVKVGARGIVHRTPNSGETYVTETPTDWVVTPGDGSGMLLGQERLFGASECRFAPHRAGTGDAVWVEGKPYRGEMVVRVDRGVVRVVNEVALETYVSCVLAGEMPIKWPDAALRAQAIAARTYAVWQWKHRRSDDHDLMADTRSQVYTGAATARAIELVSSTQGRVLSYNGRLFEAFFSSTCAGETASAEWVFGGPSIPPLQGAICGKCFASSHAVWRQEIAPADLAKALAPFGVKPPIVRVETSPWPRAGYVRELKVVHSAGETTIDGVKARQALGLKSASFEVAASPQGSLVVTGHGWGHGVGLCQWGAKGCAEEGLSEDAILKKYYPAAEILKLY